MLRTSFPTSLRSSKVHNEIHNCKQSLCSAPELKEANQMHCLQMVCEYDYELSNFATNFGTKFATFREKCCDINCKGQDKRKPVSICPLDT
jgi:hypothetical protein